MVKQIEHVIIFGDSLSDRGTMAHRKLFGLIPMDGLSGLKGNSPHGRFNNQYSYDDALGTAVSVQRIIKKLKDHGLDSTDIADAVAARAPVVEDPLSQDFNLDNDHILTFKHRDFLRSYCEGGLTDHDYSRRLSWNIKIDFEEQILATLAAKRQLMLEDDKALDISQEHRDKSLIIDWSGANDLITINTELSKEAVEKAIAARIENLKELIKNGYTNFALFDLPNLAYTPRYQRKSLNEQHKAHDISAYFNRRLREAVEELKEYSENAIDIEIFDVNETFEDVYKNPRRYGLDPAKKHTPLLQSKDFEIKPNGSSPGRGHMFWDDVHPTAAVQQILFDKFYKKYSEKYHFTVPHESLLDIFRETYGQKLIDDKRGFFGFFRRSKIDYKSENLKIETILWHALYGKGERTREVITQLGWINKDGQLISKHPSLITAMDLTQQQRHEDKRENFYSDDDSHLHVKNMFE